MKHLFLMRHGKSSWELNVSDQDRTLLKRGMLDAELIGGKLFERDINIDKVYSSPANRAMHTAVICLQSMNFPLEKLSITPDLYDFSGEMVVSFIKNLSDDMSSVLIFGHNHAFTYIANAMGSKHIDNVPTCGFVHLQFNEDTWAAITEGSTIETLFPKQDIG